MGQSSQAQVLEQVMLNAGIPVRGERIDYILRVARMLHTADRQERPMEPASKYVAMAMSSMGAENLAESFVNFWLTGQGAMAA